LTLNGLKDVPIEPIGVTQKNRFGLHRFDKASKARLRKRQIVWCQTTLILHAFDGHGDPPEQMLGATRTEFETTNGPKGGLPELIFQGSAVGRGKHLHFIGNFWRSLLITLFGVRRGIQGSFLSTNLSTNASAYF
jgi:hypothetical protein